MESRRREWNFYCLAKSGMATTGSTPLHIKNSFGGGVLNINYYFFFFLKTKQMVLADVNGRFDVPISIRQPKMLVNALNMRPIRHQIDPKFGFLPMIYPRFGIPSRSATFSGKVSNICGASDESR